MKKLLWVLLTAVAAVAVALTSGVVEANAAAQSNTATAKPASTNASDHAFVVSSDHGTFDGKTGQVVGYGNVVVTNAQVTLTCERLTVNFPVGSDADHPTNAIAETNVYIVAVDTKGETNHLNCDKAIYTYNVAGGITNELYTFTGHCTNRVRGDVITGEPMIWDVMRQNLDIKHFHLEGTNASGFNMNIQR